MEKNLLSDTAKLTVHGKIFIKLSSMVKWRVDCILKECFVVGKRVKTVLVVCISCCLASFVKRKR